MTRKELLQIPGLGDVLKALEDTPPPSRALEPPPKCPPNLAAPGEVWRVVEPQQQSENQDYSAINPHCSTVLLLKREDDFAGEHAVFRAAPILADIRYCGVEDAIFPREVFGYEAAVACGCEFTLTSKELDRCEGVLPDEWFDRLADFAAWMEADESEAPPAFPPFLKTGRPFTHTDDPGYVFHSNLATNLQPLMATVLDCVLETAEAPAGYSVPEPYAAEIHIEEALAAAESSSCEQKVISHLLPGFTGFACESGRRPSEATLLTFSCAIQQASHPPASVVVSWPDDTGARRETAPCSFRSEFRRWTTRIEIELPWDKALVLLDEGKIVVSPAE